MKRFVLVLTAAAALGLGVPAAASAQDLGGLIGEVIKVQGRARFDDDRRDRGNHGRGNENRGNQGRGDDRGARGRGEERGPPVYRGEDRGPPVYREPPRNYPPPRGRPNPYQQPGESWRPSGPTGGEISMSQAIRIVQMAAGPGRHLDGEREERGGRTYYRIQWATDRGERRDYYVDAQTGALIGR